MNEYTIEITETLQKQVKIKAKNVIDAISQVKASYYNCEIELNENDLVDTDFTNIISKTN